MSSAWRGSLTLLNAFTTGNLFFLTNSLEFSTGRHFGALKGFSPKIVGIPLYGVIISHDDSRLYTQAYIFVSHDDSRLYTQAYIFVSHDDSRLYTQAPQDFFIRYQFRSFTPTSVFGLRMPCLMLPK